MVRLVNKMISILCVFSIFLSLFVLGSVNVYASKSSVVVSMGDSYASGEGVEPFYGSPKSTNKEEFHDWLAHRSQNVWSGQLVLNSLTKNLSHHRNENWFFVAASGAETKNIEGIQEKEYKRKDIGKGKEDLAPQIDVFNTLNKKGIKADYVTLSLGGNDAGFATVLTTAVLSGPSYLRVNWFHSYVELCILKIPNVIQKLKNVYFKISEKAGKQACLIVVGYPQLVDAKKCNGSLINSNEAIIINSAVSLFNKNISALVENCKKKMKIEFVSVENAFKGHSAYAGKGVNGAWICGLEMLVNSDYKKTNDLETSSFASSRSMHPNKYGQEAYRLCVQDTIDKLEGKKQVPAVQKDVSADIVAEDLINKSVSEIVNMMGNEFNVETIDAGYFYNYNKFPGMNFHVGEYFDNKEKLREFINSGNASLMGIQVNSPGKGCRNGDKILSADMDFAKFSEIYGKVSCKPSTGALISGAMEAIGYTQKKSGYTITVNFKLTHDNAYLISKEEISYEDMLQANPNIRNIVIRRDKTDNRYTSYEDTTENNNVSYEENIAENKGTVNNNKTEYKETLRLQKTGYINGTLYYTHDQNFEYVNNGKASILPDNLKDKIGKFFVLDDYIYYIPTHIVGSDGFNVELRRIHFDGSGEELILNDLPYKGKCFYANGGIIYESTDKDSVIYLNLETKQATTLFQKRPSSFWVYGDKIYFVKGYSENDYSIRALSLFDGKEEVVVNSASKLILCDNGYLYYSDLDVDNIKRINLSNLSEQEIVLSEAEIINKHILLSYNEYFGGDNFDISNGVIYYANSSEIRAYDINLKTDIFLSNVQANNEIGKFKCEDGYILYTAELEVNQNGSTIAGEYIFDIQNKTTELVSKYFVSSW